jgi:aspartate carbamoyltransferase regulatory subunit
LNCPGCDVTLCFYTKDGRVRKSYGVIILEDGRLTCEYCEAILSYQAKEKG